MKPTQVKEGFSKEYSLYQSESEPDKYYALHDAEINKMTLIKLQFDFKPIPDKYTVKVFNMKEVAEGGVYDIVDKNPIDHRINDLISIGIEVINTKHK